jgi:hypothetical protein
MKEDKSVFWRALQVYLQKIVENRVRVKKEVQICILATAECIHKYSCPNLNQGQ